LPSATTSAYDAKVNCDRGKKKLNVLHFSQESREGAKVIRNLTLATADPI
jgi:hypothetical protein